MYHYIKKNLSVTVNTILIILLACTTWYFVSSFESYYTNGELHTIYHYRDATRVSQDPKSIMHALHPWMTFDYITVVYRLPKDFLKNIFSITDPKYPNIRIDSYAKKTGLSVSVVLERIAENISQYKTQ